jgi:hypothetical protein
VAGASDPDPSQSSSADVNDCDGLGVSCLRGGVEDTVALI